MTLALPWPLAAGFALIGLAFLLVFVRLVRGPSLSDRIVALDMISYLAIGVIALWTLASGEAAYLDAALVLALLAFLATAALARYVEERSRRAPSPSPPNAASPQARS